MVKRYVVKTPKTGEIYNVNIDPQKGLTIRDWVINHLDLSEEHTVKFCGEF